jgi:uncharacterized protein
MRRKPRLVLDTNVVVSALFWNGKPLELMALAAEKRVRLYANAALLSELQVTLAKPKFARALDASGRSADEHVGSYRRLVTFNRRSPREGAWSRDPNDDHVIACALAAAADFLVTGDDDLLTLGRVEGVAIVTPAILLAELT